MRMFVAAVLFAAAPVLAAPPVLEDVRVLSGPRPAVTLRLSAPAEFRARVLEADGGVPRRLYLDLAGTTLGASAPRVCDGAAPSLLRVRTGQFDPETTRVVLDLPGNIPFEVSRNGSSLTVTLGPPSSTTGAPSASSAQKPMATAEPKGATPEPPPLTKPDVSVAKPVPPALPVPPEKKVTAPEPVQQAPLAKAETKTPVVEPTKPAMSPSVPSPDTSPIARNEPRPLARVEPPPFVGPPTPPPFVGPPAPPPFVGPLAALPFVGPVAPPPFVGPPVPPPFVGPPAPPAFVGPLPVPQPTQVAINEPLSPQHTFIGPPAPPTPAAVTPPRPLTPQDVIVMNAPRSPIAEETTTTTGPPSNKGDTSVPGRVAGEVGPPAPPPASGRPATKRPPQIAAAARPTPLVVLDAGHGGRDPGAEGVGGVIEKDVVLELTRVLAKRMNERLHVNVFLTRSDDSYVTIDRRLAVPSDATVFISLHANSCPDPSARGLEIFYGGGAVRPADTAGASPRAAMLGRYLGEALSARVGGLRGSARPGGFSILVRNPLPTALIEIGYLTHPEEAALSQDTAYRALMADAVVDGLEAFLRAAAPPL